MSLRATPYILGGAGIAAFAVALNYTLRGRALEEVPGMPPRDPFKPPKPGELEASIPSHTVQVVDRAPANAIPASAQTVVKPKPSSSASNSAQLAAASLYTLVTTPPVNWGTRAAPNAAITSAQRAMGGGIQADGVYGPKTAARGAALLNRAFPARPAAQPAAAAAPASAPRPAASTPRPAAPPAASNEPRSSSPDAPQPATAAAKSAEETRTPKQAAQQLYTYVVPLVKAGNLAELGSKTKPNNFVANCQRDMRLIESDGIYGPKTAARGKELLGREFPARSPVKKRVSTSATLPPNWKVEPPGALTAVPEATIPVDPPAGPLPQLWPGAAKVLEQMPPAPSSTKRAPKDAAAALYALVTQDSFQDWGSRAHPNTLIAAAQRDMGSVTADGVYGPKTAARAAALLGRAMPARGTFLG